MNQEPMNPPQTTQNISPEVLAMLCPLCALMPAHLQALSETLEQQWLFNGDTLFEQGQFDTRVFYLLYGTVECRYSNGDVETLEAYETLAPLGNEQPRPFTMVAVSDCSVISFEREQLDTLLAWSQTAEYLLADISVNRDLDEDSLWMSTILRSNLFLKVPPTNMGKLFKYVTSELVFNGDVIIRQGEYGERCYFIKEGSAEVTRRNEAKTGWDHVADIGPGRCFGEDALVQQTVRNANVTMTSDGVLMILQKAGFLELLREDRVPSLVWCDWLQHRKNVVVIDVRTESEYSRGHLRNAINVPLNLLSLKQRLLPEDKSLLVYCDTGRRSRTAVKLLMEQGISAVCLKDGTNSAPRSEYNAEVTSLDYVIRAGEVVAVS
jgi:CRP-like cAMP-binding protein/rhodanese-related sulfurtransferase